MRCATCSWSKQSNSRTERASGLLELDLALASVLVERVERVELLLLRL